MSVEVISHQDAYICWQLDFPEVLEDHLKGFFSSDANK